MMNAQTYENCWIVRDPVLKSVGKEGKLIAITSIAFNPYKNSEASFIEVVAWEKKAEQFVNLKKGQKVNITGHLFMQAWQDDDGRKHQKHKINVQNWQTLAYERRSEKTAEAGAQTPNSAAAFDSGALSDDDIPF